MTLIFAHRGAAGTHPENTMAAFIEAEKAGADGIELDVQLTKDGEVVVIHDETVDRTTDGSGWVKDITYRELRRLNAAAMWDGKHGHCISFMKNGALGCLPPSAGLMMLFCRTICMR